MAEEDTFETPGRGWGGLPKGEPKPARAPGVERKQILAPRVRWKPVRLPEGFELPLPDGERDRLCSLAHYALPREFAESVHARVPQRPLAPYSRLTLVKMVRTFPNWRKVFRDKLKELIAAENKPTTPEAVQGTRRMSGRELRNALLTIRSGAKRSIALFRLPVEVAADKPKKDEPVCALAAENGNLIPSEQLVAHFATPPKGGG